VILAEFERSGVSAARFAELSVSKNVWNCFSECKHGGNTLDFIARMEKVSIHAAATKAIEWFNLDREAVSSSSRQEEEPESEAERQHATASTAFRW
jgi:hypothetical protein